MSEWAIHGLIIILIFSSIANLILGVMVYVLWAICYDLQNAICIRKQNEEQLRAELSSVWQGIKQLKQESCNDA